MTGKRVSEGGMGQEDDDGARDGVGGVDVGCARAGC